MNYYLYKTANLLTCQYYIGCRSTIIEPTQDTKYLGSGQRLQHSIKKYGIENFKKEVLFLCKDAETKFYYESTLVTENTLQDPLCMNLKTGGEGGSAKGRTLSDTSKLRMRKPKSEKHRENISTANKGRSSFKGRRIH